MTDRESDAAASPPSGTPALIRLERELERLVLAKAQRRRSADERPRRPDDIRYRDADGNAVFSGRLVAIEDASGCSDLHTLSPSHDWRPAALEMVGFSIADSVRQARPPSCPQYAALFRDVRVVAGMAAILDPSAGEIVSDAVSRRRKDLDLAWYRERGLDVAAPARARCRAGNEPALRVDRAVSLFSWANSNYAHWLLEKLASLCWIGSAGLPDDTRLLVESGLPDQVVESLELLWPAERIVYVEPGTAVDVGLLHYFSDAAEIWEPRRGHVYDGHDYRICPEAMRWLAGAVRARIRPLASQAPYAYLVRPFGGNGRAVLNQEAVATMLGERGYASLQPGEFDFRGQAARFSTLRRVVSPSGAALANLLWMPRGGTVVVLAVDSPQTCYWFYHALAAALGIRLVFYPVQGIPWAGQPSFHWNVEVPLQPLADWLDQDALRGGSGGDIDVTVTVMSYNNADYIAQTVRSVLDQTGVSLELIVRDDASTDDSLHRLAPFAGDPRFRIEANPRNLGMAANVDRCLQSGSGRYVVVLGSDDVMRPGHLASLVAAMDAHPQAALGYTQCDWIDGRGELLRRMDHPGHLPHSYCGGRNEVADLLSFDDYITPSAMMIRRQVLERIRLPDGGLHADMPAGDWDLVVRIAEAAPDFVFLRQHSIGYRVHDRQISQGFYASSAPLENHIRILEGVIGRGRLDRLKGREDAVAALLQQRLAQYPKERDLELGRRARQLYRQLEASRARTDAPMFSVVVTTYDRPALLADALDSIARQTLRDFEVILVNDHGPCVERLLARYDFPIAYLRQSRNSGPAAARNAAHRLACGRYLVYLDDDDLFLPDHLQVLAEALAERPDEVVYTDALFLTESIEEGARRVLAEERRYRHGRYSHRRLSVDNYIPINTFAWPRALLADVGDFDESLPALEDWDFLLRLASRTRFHHVLRETVQVRMRIEGGQRRSEQALKQYPALYRQIYARHSDLDDEAVRQRRAARLRQLGVPSSSGANEAIDGWRAARIPNAAQRPMLERWFQSREPMPRVGVAILDGHGDAAAIERTLRSLRPDERSEDWIQAKVLAATGAGAPDAGETTPAGTARTIAWDGADPVAALDTAIDGWEVDWVIAVDAGSEFAEGGLLRLRMELCAAAADLRALYADEWYRDDEGTLAPVMRPDLNLDLLLGNPAMMARHWLFRRQALVEVGGFAPGTGPAAELDLILRLIQHGGLAGIAHLPEPLLTCAPPLIDAAAQRDALIRHLRARGYADAQVGDVGPGLYRIDYGHGRQPSVSMVVVAPPGLALATLERCVVSILERTRYPDYELLLLDNGAPAEVGHWLDRVEPLAAGKVRAFRLDPPLAHAAACNMAAAQARGEFVLFLRAEAAAVQPQWLDELLNHGLRPEVAVTGARTVSADGRITHAGLVPALLDSGGRAFAGLAMDAPGYMNRLQVAQDCSAVSDGCLLIGKALFDELGGFDHAAFPDAGADVDLCLRAAARGGLTVCTPHALLLHPAEPTPLPEPAQDALLERWLPAIAHDPAYNPNLRLDTPGGFRLGESDFSWRPLPAGALPRILAQPADPWGSGHYRVIQPFRALQEAGLAEGALYATLLDPVELARIEPDVVVLQRRVGDEDIARMRRMRRFSRAFSVYELDDWLPNLPLKNAHRADMPTDIVRALRAALAQADRFVVATAALAEAFAGFHERIRVAENRLDPATWRRLPAAPERPPGARPRVGWAGGASHDGDLELIADVVRELAGEVDWVFFGLCPERLRPYVKEFHRPVDFKAYPAALARLGLDLALAPLEDNPFNHCKSRLRLLEYGACGYPVVCSDLEPYRGALPATRVRNRFRDWVGAIREHLADRQACAAAGQALRRAVLRDWMLEGPALEEWRRAWLPD